MTPEQIAICLAEAQAELESDSPDLQQVYDLLMDAVSDVAVLMRDRPAF